MPAFYLTADIGGTQIRAALCDAVGHIYHRAQELTLAQEGRDAVIGRIQATLAAALADIPPSQVGGIGIVAPGPLDPVAGVIVFAPNLPGWNNVPLRRIMQEHFGIPTLLGNDANLAALGEHRFGAGRGVHHLIYLTVSTGIGGGIIIDDRMLVGARGFAAEVGHHTILADGLRCNCGNVGCLEALAAGPAIARNARAAIAEGRPTRILDLTPGRDPQNITAHIVTDAAKAGDALARELLAHAGFYIGVGIVNLLHILNPGRVVIGGGVSFAGDLLFVPIRQTVDERAPLAFRKGVDIVPAALGDDAGLLGVASLAFEAGEAHAR